MEIVHTGICVVSNTTKILEAYSGSPLIHNGTVIGVNSGLTDYEMLFVSINGFYGKWIHNMLLKDKKQSRIIVNLEVALPLPAS